MSNANPADPLGFDVWVREDIDPSGRSASGVELVENAIYHRLTTDQLFLVGSPDDGYVEYGEDVRKWVGEVVDQESANAKAPQLAIVLQRDPRISPASIAVSIDARLAGEKYAFTISITCRTTSELPIALVLGVNAVTVELLSQGR